MAKRLLNLSLAVLIVTNPVTGAIADEAVWASFGEADQAYNDAIRQQLTIEDRVAELKAETTGSDVERAGRLYLASLLQWRHGDRDGALASVRAALQFGRHGELLRQEARLLDASGKIGEAIQVYREAVALLSGEARLNTELRLALLIASDSEDIEPLLSLAERGDDAFRNRIAMALSVLGYPGDAARLYTLSPNASAGQQLRDRLRLVEWALQDQDVLKARKTAWQVVERAETPQDRRYALALLTESHRLDDSLPELAEQLEADKELGADTRSLLVNLLREIGRSEDALAALKGRAEKEPRDVKRQLVGIYRESGKTAGMVTELERLMTVDPDETIWPQGLAELYLERGEPEAARAAWRTFVEHCGASPALLSGAETMQKLEFDELALAAAEKAQQDPASIKHAVLFRFELNLERGRYDEARAVLEELESTTDAADPIRKIIALSYERLKLPNQALRVMTEFTRAGDAQDVAAKQYLARLLVSVGEPEKAVDTLLVALEDAAASQRRLIQTRLIAAANAAGIEDKLAAGLTDKLRRDSATEAETQLLIEMRTRAGDEDEVLELIETLYGKPGADPVMKLKELAALHRSFSNWWAYEDVLIQLAEQDPDNAVLHIRARIMNHLDNLRPVESGPITLNGTPVGSGRITLKVTPVESGQMALTATPAGREAVSLETLLQEYAAVSSAGADREFEAGVLSLARENRRALALFREIVAAAPSRLDNYQAIGNQLRALHGKAPAVGMYQYLVESAEREALSWVALDGILNLEPDQATLKWASRLALERLTAQPSGVDYYLQLADLFGDTAERTLQLSALRNGLSAAPELRMSTLRELLRLTGEEGADRRSNEMHVAFGRRLLALGLAMPPDVYIALGRAMLEAGDTQAALQAVIQAADYTGSGKLLVQAADIFHEAGDDLSANRLFEKALTRDSANIGLIVRTALSDERLGDNERAGKLFLDGMTTLLGRRFLQVDELLVFKGANQLPETPDPKLLNELLLDEGREALPHLYHVLTGSTHAGEYQQYYIPLRNGLVRVLSRDPSRRAAAFDRLRNDYHTTLSEVAARQEKLPRLANYPRLNLQAQLLRYLSYTFGEYADVQTMDETLLRQFPEDPLLPEILVFHRMEWGGVAYPDRLERSTLLTDEQKVHLKELWVAIDSEAGDERLAVKTDIRELIEPTGGGVSETLSRSYQQVLKDQLDAAVRSGDSAAIVSAVKELLETELIWDTLEDVEDLLSAEQKKTVARHAITILRNDKQQAANSLLIEGGLNSNVDLKTKRLCWAERLAGWSGDRALDEETLMELTKEPELRGPPFDLLFVYQELSQANREKWLQRRVINSGGWSNDMFFAGPPGVAGTESLIALLLQTELDDRSAEFLKRAVRKHEGMAQLPMIRRLIEVDIHPDNTALTRELLILAAQKHSKYIELGGTHTPDPLLEPNLLRSEGRIDEALNSLVDIFFNGDLSPSGERDVMLIVKLYQNRLVTGNEARLIEILDGASDLSPTQKRDRNYWQAQLRLTMHRSDPDKLLGIVLDALASDPGNTDLLQLASNLYGFSGEKSTALRLMRERLEHLPFDPNVPRPERAVHLGNLMQTALELDHPLKALAYQESLGQFPPTLVAALTKPLGTQLEDAVRIRRALSADDHAALRREAVRVWQNVQVGERMIDGADALLLGVIVQMVLNVDEFEAFLSDILQGRQQGALPAAIRMLSVLAQHPLGVEILEPWVRSVRGRLLGDAQELIGALADAHVHSGSAPARFAELTAGVRERRVGDKEIGLWLAIGSRVPGLAAGDEAGDVLAAYLRSETAYRPFLLLGAARFLCARGDFSGALKVFQSLIDWTRAQASAGVYRDDFSLNSILKVAAVTLDSETYRVLLRSELDRVKPWKAHLLPGYSEFVLDQFDAVRDKEAFHRTFKADLDDALAVLRAGQDGLPHARSAPLIRVAVTQFRLGRKTAALYSLKKAMEAKVEEEQQKDRAEIVNHPMILNAAADTYAGSRSETAAEQIAYARQLGIGITDFDLEAIFQTYIFPSAALPGLVFASADQPSLEQAESQIRDWVEAGEIDRDIATHMLLGVARAYGELDADAALGRLFAYLQSHILDDEDITPETAAAVVTEAVLMGHDLDNPRLEKQLLLKGAIEPRFMAAVLRRVARAEGDAEALELGGALLEFTLEDRLMDELIGLAERSGNAEQAHQWRVLQNRAQIARKELQQLEAAI